jgi:hypothetical protein
MITHVAKLVWNTNQYQSCSGIASNGVVVNGHNVSYCYGLEEWMFNDFLKNMKIGYLDCYRLMNRSYPDVANIALISVNPKNKHILHIGNVLGVKEIYDNEIETIRGSLDQQNWLQDVVSPNFEMIEACPPNQAIGYNEYFENNFSSNEIRTEAPRGFIVNMRYDKIEFFEPENQASLTQIDAKVNLRWKRLTQRYIIDDRISNPLKKYFSLNEKIVR